MLHLRLGSTFSFSPDVCAQREIRHFLLSLILCWNIGYSSDVDLSWIVWNVQQYSTENSKIIHAAWGWLEGLTTRYEPRGVNWERILWKPQTSLESQRLDVWEKNKGLLFLSHI